MKISLDKIAYHLSSSKTKPNKMMREEVLPFLLENNVQKILDYGCGKFLRDSLLLTENGFEVDAVDMEEQIEIIDKEKAKRMHGLSTKIKDNNYDAALLNFVLQVLPTEKQRKETLKNVYNAIRKGGYLIFSLRNTWDIKKYAEPSGIPFKDGFVMEKTNTFVRGYTKKELTEILRSLNMDIIRIHSSSVSYVSISKK